jgi:tRNA U34 5-methylaminomethyl-2-thiouridine-forming methyltransferase MnmC
MQRRIIQTADGSHSLYVEGLDEHYHSVHGAIQESKHVFIKTGLQHLHKQGKQKISILEIGLGTGLNALLTYLEAKELGMEIHYSGLESFPLGKELLDQLNYTDMIASISGKRLDDVSEIFERIHFCEWEKENRFTEEFFMHKINSTLQEVELEEKYDLIYFDAFGPRVQPEMWTDEIFSKIAGVTKQGGCLVTYCSKGEVQRCMKRAGFSVEKLQGPPGKREMLRAERL